MRTETDLALSGLTTLRLGGPARRVLTAETEAEVVAAVRAADASGEQLLVLGGGSNLVVADHGFDGTVVRIGTGFQPSAPVSGELVVGAGAQWDAVVADSLDQGLAGIEALSGIPGLTGAAPIQNIGAYGQDVAQTVRRVRALDRRSGDVVELSNQDCRFGYRTSMFKGSERYVVLSVAFALEPSRLGAPVRYAELARRLGVEPGRRVAAGEVREAVLDLRRSKGMLLDAEDPDTTSAGSFFTNPILSLTAAADLLPAAAPRWAEDGDRVKTSAAWLIESAGFGPGYGEGAVRLSTKHTLALTNRGGATTSDLLALAREIRDTVQARFAITLEPEPVLLGCAL